MTNAQQYYVPQHETDKEAYYEKLFEPFVKPSQVREEDFFIRKQTDFTIERNEPEEIPDDDDLEILVPDDELKLKKALDFLPKPVAIVKDAVSIDLTDDDDELGGYVSSQSSSKDRLQFQSWEEMWLNQDSM